MVLPNPNNGTATTHVSVPDLLHSFKTGGTLNFLDFATESLHLFNDEIDSNCSTPYVSAPSSPGRTCGYFFSAPTSPMHCMFSSVSSSPSSSAQASCSVSGSFEFEFSSRFTSDASVGTGSMSSADELFCNGKIRPMKLSSHLQRPQTLAPLLDLEAEEDEQCNDSENVDESVMRGRDLKLRSKSIHRKTRSMSPLRNLQFRWPDDDVIKNADVTEHVLEVHDVTEKQNDILSPVTTPSVSASSSRSSSSGRNSKKWIFLKEFLYKSKSEGSVTGKEKFWSSISFSPAKEKNTATPVSQKPKRSAQSSSSKSSSRKPTNAVVKRRTTAIPSPHELHYTANRAQAEELKKKTYLPYRQGLFGCLGFSSKGYGALNGFTRSLNPVSSR